MTNYKQPHKPNTTDIEEIVTKLKIKGELSSEESWKNRWWGIRDTGVDEPMSDFYTKVESFIATEINRAKREERLKTIIAVECIRDRVCDKIDKRGSTPFRKGQKHALTKVVKILELERNQ